MVATLGAALVALACVVAASRRLIWAAAPTPLEPRLLCDALAGDGAPAAFVSLRQVLSLDERFEWERDLFQAFAEPEGPSRDALVNEQLLELEGRADRWARVPRVCASIGTSSGLLFGSLGLLGGLGSTDGKGGTVLEAALSSALAAVAFGITATSFCMAVHLRAGRASRKRRAEVDALVDRLRWVSDTSRRSA